MGASELLIDGAFYCRLFSRAAATREEGMGDAYAFSAADVLRSLHQHDFLRAAQT